MVKILAAGWLRHALTTFGGGLIASGFFTTSDAQTIIGSLMTIFAILWSSFAKYNDRKKP